MVWGLVEGWRCLILLRTSFGNALIAATDAFMPHHVDEWSKIVV